jgi:hypothetical protein
MQTLLLVVGGGLLGFFILNVLAPLIAGWDWIRNPNRVRLRKHPQP